jgi:F-type H+-transporting ATPase subunit b
MLEIWLLIALAILIAVVWKPLSRAIVGALDGHAAKVRTELDEARRLRDEAQSLLAEHKRQLAAGQEHARSISEHARREAERQAERHRAELEASLARRTEQALGRIAQEEARAVQDVRNQAATLAIRATRRLLADQVDSEHAQILVDRAIEEVGRKLS